MAGELSGEPRVAARACLGGFHERRGLGEAALPETDPGQVEQVLGAFRAELDCPLQRLFRLEPELGLDQQQAVQRMEWLVLRGGRDGLTA